MAERPIRLEWKPDECDGYIAESGPLTCTVVKADKPGELEWWAGLTDGNSGIGHARTVEDCKRAAESCAETLLREALAKVSARAIDRAAKGGRRK